MLEDLAAALDEATRSDDGILLADPTWLVLRTFEGRDIDEITMTAIVLRMQALSDLLTTSAAREWQRSSCDGDQAVVVHPAVFHAAASATLILSESVAVPPKFDVDSFKVLALEAATPKGNG